MDGILGWVVGGSLGREHGVVGSGRQPGVGGGREHGVGGGRHLGVGGWWAGAWGGWGEGPIERGNLI